MLKRNLIAIAIVVLGLGVTSSAFAQEARKEIDKSSPKIKKPAVTVKNPKQVQPGQNSGGTISNQRTSKTRRPVPKSSLTNEQIVEAVRSPRKMKLGDIKGERSKQPRRRSTQKRQYKP